MSQYANWKNGAIAKEVQTILQQNFKTLEQQIQGVNIKPKLCYNKIKLNFNSSELHYYAETLPIKGTIVSVKFYTSSNSEVCFSCDIIDNSWCAVYSDILPKEDIYCMVIYYA